MGSLSGRIALILLIFDNIVKGQAEGTDERVKPRPLRHVIRLDLEFDALIGLRGSVAFLLLKPETPSPGPIPSLESC